MYFYKASHHTTSKDVLSHFVRNNDGLYQEKKTFNGKSKKEGKHN